MQPDSPAGTGIQYCLDLKVSLIQLDVTWQTIGAQITVEEK